MHVIARSRLLQYGALHGPDADAQLRAWYQEVKQADWSSSQDLRQQFPSARVIDNELVIFNICNNRFRLIVKVWYTGRQVYIKFFGTHADYDRLDLSRL